MTPVTDALKLRGPAQPKALTALVAAGGTFRVRTPADRPFPKVRRAQDAPGASPPDADGMITVDLSVRDAITWLALDGAEVLTAQRNGKLGRTYEIPHGAEVMTALQPGAHPIPPESSAPPAREAQRPARGRAQP